MGEGIERLEELVGEEIDDLASQALEESGVSEGLRDEEGQKEQLRQSFLQVFQEERDRVVRGHGILQERVPTTEIMPMEKIYELAKKADEALSYNDVLEHPDSFIVDLYRECVLILNEGHVEEAADALLFLLHMDRSSVSIWLAYGGVEEQLERWDSALGAHLTASLVDPEDPEPMVSAARVLMNMGHNDKALEALSLGREIAQGSKDERASEEIEAMMRWLKDQGGS